MTDKRTESGKITGLHGESRAGAQKKADPRDIDQVVTQLRKQIRELESTNEALRQTNIELGTALCSANSELGSLLEKRRPESQATADTLPTSEWTKLPAILDELPCFACVIAQDRSVQFANRNARRLFGSPDGRRCYEFMFGYSQPCENCSSLKEPGEQSREGWEWGAPSGRNYQIMSSRFVGGGGVCSTLEIGADVTDRSNHVAVLRDSERELSRLSSELLTAREMERKRISRELHDQVGQALTLMKLRLGMIVKKLRKDQSALREQCNLNLAYFDQVIEDVRRMSRELCPSILEDLGLDAALHRLADDFSKERGIKVTVESRKVDHLFPQQSRIGIYRILQEALNGIAKLPDVAHIKVSVWEQEQEVIFQAEIPGSRVRPGASAAPEAPEIPVISTVMNQRALMLGGRVELPCHADAATCIRLLVPIAIPCPR